MNPSQSPPPSPPPKAAAASVTVGRRPGAAPATVVGQIALAPRTGPDAARFPLDRGPAVPPQSADALAERSLRQANQMMTQARFHDAERILKQAVVDHPGSLRLRRNLVAVLLMLSRNEEARTLIEPLLKALPDDENLLLNHATVLFRLEHLHEARLALEELVRRYPGNAMARTNLASIFLNNLHQPERALELLSPILPTSDQDASVQFAMGCICGKLGQLDRAMAHYDRALALRPGHLESLSNQLFVHHYAFPVDLERVRDIAQRHGRWLQDDARRRGWVKPPAASRAPAGRLRIGVLSADLRAHPVGHFLESVLDALRQRPVELFAYANQSPGSVVPSRIRGAFVRWHDVLEQTDERLASTIAADDLDVLLDLSGHTTGNRLGVLLRRPARRQVSWLGYFGTTGLPCMDAVIADPHCVPESETRFFCERVLRMPHSRFCLTAPPDAPEVAPDPPWADLPHIRFGCFQNANKINDHVLALWQRILQASPGAVLRLQNGQFELSAQVLRMRERLREAGIDLRRVWISPILPREHYLGQYAEVDVLLDTFPYPGGTTTSEALWMGVPTLTLATPGMLGRQGQALLENVGLGDWVTHSPDDYVAHAVALARDRAGTVARLRQLRRDLRETARTSPLFDAPRFAKDFEALLRRFCS
jgi:predicted O-linked N-acetylglucosamine transferase (SPINDLY family)